MAIEVISDSEDKKIAINPKNEILESNTVGFFIASSAEDAKR